MPKIVKRLVSQLRSKGMSKDKAWAVATKKQQEAGNIKKGSNKLTTKGAKRQAMGASGRAKSRAVKQGGGKTSDYKYSRKTNIATKK